MPIISNQQNFFCDNHFVFSGNNILIRNTGDENHTLCAEDLPAEETLRKCLDNDLASDWFAEPNLNYCAVMLEEDSPVPAGCHLIPLRQFFWDSKDEEGHKNANPSQLGSLASRAHGFLCLRQQYRFCPKCGTRLAVHSSEIAKICPECGRLDFPRIEPAIIVLVSKGDEILLVRSKTTKSGFWGCVAGFVEHGETIEQCVQREVMEETSISIQNIKYQGSQSWPFPDQLMLAFTADYKEGDIKIQEEELTDARWFNRNDLPEIPKPGSVAYNLIYGLFSHCK